jgi:mono/diheme cytochrome c family protein
MEKPGRAWRRALRLGLVVATVGVPRVGRAQSPPPPPPPDTGAMKSVLAGVYTAPQARSGEVLFRNVCAQCHALAQFQDASFLRSWEGRSARDLFELIRTQMPQDNPGQLKREEYAAVLAYLFELNDFPPGDSTLAAGDALRRVRIERRPP